MNLRLLNLNIEKGRFLNRIIRFIQKEKFDIIHLQEVSGGLLQQDGLDCFEVLQEELGLKGHLGIYLRKMNRPDTYVANAVFHKQKIKALRTETIWLRDFVEVEDVRSVSWTLAPRNAIAVTLSVGRRELASISTHLPWTIHPGDTPEKLDAGSRLVRFVRTLPVPFVLTGDFNVSQDSKIIRDLEKHSINLTVRAGITNTLDLSVHKARKKLPPLGLAIDFAFMSKDIWKAKVHVVDDEHLADHLGQIVEFEI